MYIVTGKEKNTRKLLLLNLVREMLLMRPGHPGYISHREIRRWRAGAKDGLLGVCWEGHTDDDSRLESAIALKTPFPEYAEDMGTSSDEGSVITVPEESEINDPEKDDGGQKRAKKPRTRRVERPAVPETRRPVLCPETCRDPNCPGRIARERARTPPPLITLTPTVEQMQAAALAANPDLGNGNESHHSDLES